MKKGTNILICSGGKRVDLIKEFQRILRGQGRVMITDANEWNAGKFFADAFFKAPRVLEKTYLPFIKKIIKQHRIDLVFSVIDTELPVLAKYQKELEAIGTTVLSSPFASVSITSDKRKTARFFQKIGILTPEVYTLKNIRKFPVFIKPYDGSRSQFAYRVNNAREFATFKSIVPHPIVMQFIDGQEYTVDCLSDFSGNVINVIPRKRVETSNGISVKSVVDMDPAIIKDSIKILQALKARGPTTIQLIRTKTGKRYFTEVNLRFGGAAMLGIASGGDFAKKMIDMLKGRIVKFSNHTVKNGYAMVAYLDHQFIDAKN
jgi:carbamoyl-phosphate synthase large subunit